METKSYGVITVGKVPTIKGFLAWLSIPFIIAASIMGALAYATPSVPVLSQNVPVGQVIQTSVAIANAGTTSASIPTHALSLVGIQLPATMTSTAITFKVSMDGTTFQPLYNSAGQVSYTIAGGRYVAINPADFYGAAYIEIVCGSSEGAARTLTTVMKGI